ncbi:hypothetical protein [Brevibacterium linens]|uniref:hypothetical protein n=1 Tax=Brevibacterium linens TaxID=1703 RepID=UPI003BF5242D
MTWTAKAATVLRVVRVEAGSFKLSAGTRIVIGISSRLLLADDTEPIPRKHCCTEGDLVLPVISPLTGGAAPTVGGALMVRAP